MIILIATKWLIVVCSFHLSFVADVGCLSTWECNEMMQSYFSLPSVVDCCLFYFVAYVLYVVVYCCMLLFLAA